MPASPTIDGTPQPAHGGGASIAAPAFTSSLANDIVYVVVEVGNGTSTPPTVSSVTGGGLTFTQRGALTSLTGTNCTRMEIWTAQSTGALTSQVFTANLSASATASFICVLAVHGAFSLSSPFDPNAGLPSLSSENNTAPNTTFNTTSADDLLLSFISGPGNYSATNTPPTGWTNITNFNNFGNNYLLGAYLSVSAVQSGASVPWGSAGVTGTLLIDAFTADGGGGATLIPPIDTRRNRTYLRR